MKEAHSSSPNYITSLELESAFVNLCFCLEAKKARYGGGVACPCPAVESEVPLGLPSAELGCRTYSGPEPGAGLGNWEGGASSDTSVETCVQTGA